MTSFVKIDEEGISFYRFSKLNKLYQWDEIRCYEDSSFGRLPIILFTLKNDEDFYLDNRKHIIKDKGNQNRLNIYYDMLLEVN